MAAHGEFLTHPINNLAMPSIFLYGLELNNYRGFGPVEQKLAPFKTFNFFIGANNSGKSSLLSFIASYLPLRSPTSRTPAFDVPPLDKHGRQGHEIKVSTAVPISQFVNAALNKIADPSKGKCHPLIERVAKALADDDMIWFTSALPYLRPVDVPSCMRPGASNALLPDQWSALWRGFKVIDPPGELSRCVDDCLRFLREAQSLQLPPVCLVPAIREIGPTGEDFDNSGKGLIDRLAELQNPGHDRRQDRETFEQINRFLIEVTGVASARIEIPHDRRHILVTMNELTLPLQSLGTGIHEVIMLAAFCTFNERRIICIEEPEIHLHPVLQRKLIRYLGKSTTNQYFIATHSASFIDTPGAAIFHVSNNGKETSVKQTVLSSDRFVVCQELGYKASDLLQANAIVWVEGPSDRIYLAHWISALAPEFIEGIHYSIMFYGGRLLSHLSASDEEVDKFIALRSLNRHVAVVMDSDRDAEKAGINCTKRRLQDEFEKAQAGLAWITGGREIENYVDHRQLQAAVAKVYKGSYLRSANGGPFDHSLYFLRAHSSLAGKEELFTDVDKVKVARVVCEQAANLKILDLDKQLGKVVSMIRRANQ